MRMLPGPAQTVAICLSMALPLLLFVYAQACSIRSAGSRFRISCVTSVMLFLIACITVPGERHVDDVVGGTLLLATAMLLIYVIWSLLAWGFTLTLLTTLARSERPLTEADLAAAYAKGGDLGTLAHNRLKLLLRSGLVVADDGKVIATPIGMMIARFAIIMRLAMGLDGSA